MNKRFEDVQKLRIVLRFCQHTRLAFLARNLPPDVMMRPADASFNPGHGDILQRSSNCFCPGSHTGLNCTRHSSTGPGIHCDTLSAHELAWYRVIVELPHHIGHGSVLQRDCSHGFLAGFAALCLRMGCWSESCFRSQHLKQLCPSSPQTASR